MAFYPFHNVMRITKSNGELMLGSKSILDAQDDDVNFSCDLSTVSVIRLQVTGNIATSVHVDEQWQVIRLRFPVDSYSDRVVISSRDIKFLDM
jgi:hypothetical protein